MKSLPRTQRIALKPATTIAAAVLLLLVGIVAMLYQVRSAHSERVRQLTAQANTLAASVTAAIAFNDRAAAQEYVSALMLDPRVDAAAVFDESGQRVAGEQRAGSAPIAGPLANGHRVRDSRHLLRVEVPARQGATTVGSVWLRAAPPSWTMQMARFSGVALLTVMAVLMLSVLALAQRALASVNAKLRRRAEELAEANARLIEEMEFREQAEEALRQSQKMEAVGQLSGGIAHDFNNLLMVVKTALTLLEMRMTQNDTTVEHFALSTQNHVAAGVENDPSEMLQTLERGLELVNLGRARREQIARYLQTAQSGIDKAADLTRRLLGFARQQPLSPKSLKLDELIKNLETLLEHSIRSNVHIHYRLNSHWHVLCDANQMESSILNLVINARDAMPDGGDITISTLDLPADPDAGSGPAAGDQVRLRVTDTGTGMTPEVQRRALDPFFTTKPLGKGTGLGLSTVLGYVAQSNGQLDIHSRPGVGTTIDILLPRDAGDSIQSEP